MIGILLATVIVAILVVLVAPILLVGGIVQHIYYGGRGKHLPRDQTHAAVLPDFTDSDYDEAVDEQARAIVADEDQEHLNRDYRSAVMSRFPIFTADTPIPRALLAPPLNLRDARTSNDYLYKTIPQLESANWSNQTLSYMRINTVGKHIRDCIVHPLIARGILREQCPVIDATGNIGGDSIGLALDPLIGHVTTYELLPEVHAMLVANVKLYGLEDKITTRNEKFSPRVDATNADAAPKYDVPLGSLVIIDPPYEKGNNSTNFNLSIDLVPIYVVCQRLLESGASVVMITMPREYQYNRKFASEHHQHVTAYQMGSRNNKVYVIRSLTTDVNADDNFSSHVVTADPSRLNKKGKPDPWSCVTTLTRTQI